MTTKVSLLVALSFLVSPGAQAQIAPAPRPAECTVVPTSGLPQDGASCALVQGWFDSENAAFKEIQVQLAAAEAALAAFNLLHPFSAEVTLPDGTTRTVYYPLYPEVENERARLLADVFALTRRLNCSSMRVIDYWRFLLGCAFVGHQTTTIEAQPWPFEDEGKNPLPMGER